MHQSYALFKHSLLVLAGTVVLFSCDNRSGNNVFEEERIDDNFTVIDPSQSKTVIETVAVTRNKNLSNGDFLLFGSFSDTLAIKRTHYTGVIDELVFMDQAHPKSLYLSRYNQSGVHQSTHVVGHYTDQVSGFSVEFAPIEGYYISGHFKGSITLGDKTLSHPSQSMFVALLTHSGNVVWLKHIKGSGSVSAGKIYSDSKGDLYCTGGYSGSAIFPTLRVYRINPITNRPSGTPSYINDTLTSTSGQLSDGFILRYNKQGHMIWINPVQGAGSQFVKDVTVKDEKVYVTGNFEQRAAVVSKDRNVVRLGNTEYHTVKLDTIFLDSKGNSDCFVAQYKDNGKLEWAKSFGGSGIDEASSICLTRDKVFVGGNYNSPSITYTITQEQTITNHGVQDIFALYFDLSGTLTKVLNMGSSKLDQCTGVYYNNYVGGQYQEYIFGMYQGDFEFTPGKSLALHEGATVAAFAMPIEIDMNTVDPWAIDHSGWIYGLVARTWPLSLPTPLLSGQNNLFIVGNAANRAVYHKIRYVTALDTANNTYAESPTLEFNVNAKNNVTYILNVGRTETPTSNPGDIDIPGDSMFP